METTVSFYQNCIKTILHDYQGLKTDTAETVLVVDDANSHYLVLWIGWDGYKRIHQCSLHFDIVEEKIIIQCNETEELVENTLIEMGVPADAIVLATVPPALREHSGSAGYSAAA